MIKNPRNALVIAAITTAAAGIVMLGALWPTSASRAAVHAHDHALRLWESKKPAVFAMEKAQRSLSVTKSFEIHYDAAWGFPESVDIRCSPGSTDCGSGAHVTYFRVP